MTLNINENIRRLRKERKLTQEQLSEALGVTMGAVSKWESGANVPDISIIAELADFFQVSIDALLGFELRGGSIDKLTERIFSLGAEKKFSEAAAEAEKALVKHPNNFKVVRVCANIYCMIGVELSDRSAHMRQLELYKRALELISQNTDPAINEWTIKNRIAEAYVCLDDNAKALELMKENNVQGANNGNIAHILCEIEHRYAEGLEYMCNDLVRNITGIVNDSTTGALAYIGLGEPALAEEMLRWACSALEGMLVPGKVCYIQRECARLMMTMAGAAIADGRTDDATGHLRRAFDMLSSYAAAPDNTLSGTWLMNGETHYSFDDLGDDVMNGALIKLEKLQARIGKESSLLKNYDPAGVRLTDIWNNIANA